LKSIAAALIVVAAVGCAGLIRLLRDDTEDFDLTNRMILNRLSLVAVIVCSSVNAEEKTSPIQVLVWDEQQPSQKQAYDDFLGNEIAKYLSAQPDLAVRSVRLDDAGQGLSDELLDSCQVLIYWDHARHHEVKREKARLIVKRIKNGQLAMISLHSAHWSMPFIEAMHEVTRMRAEQKYSSADRAVKIEFVRGPEFVGPQADSQITPRVYPRKFPDGKTHIKVYLPNCAFPGWREDGKPSHLTTLLPNHPIAKDIPTRFTLPATEMYDEPFHIPKPDEVVFEERWAAGEWFRSGCVWRIGKGRLFYFRPGHETFPVYKEKIPLKILDNAVRWLATD
jgi:trehalose utilization protein